MSCQPKWANSPKPKSSDGTAEMLAKCLQHCQRIVFSEDKGRYFAVIHDPIKGATRRSRNSFRDLIIAIQETVLP